MPELKRAAARLAGKTKQLAAEIIGDGKLEQEGKEQIEKAEVENATPADPLGLNQIT